MKHQYFGDINDYRKYGLLRILAGGGKLRIGVCCMLTPDDGKRCGGFTGYLDQPQKWRLYDTELFDCLKQSVRIERIRNVSQAESAKLIPSATFYTKPLTAPTDERLCFFAEMFKEFAQVDLIFFDPDNGMEVQSMPLGRKYSSKYLYWHELSCTSKKGHSVLVYQHFRREERSAFVARMADEIQRQTGAKEIHSFRTQNVVFFLASQEKHLEYLRRRARRVAEVWGRQIQTSPHGRER